MPKRIFKCYFLSLSSVIFLFTPCFSSAVPVRGLPGDLWADKILGQSDDGIPNSAFGEIKFGEAGSGTLFYGMSSVVDPVHQILFVYDSGNNRVLGMPITGLTPNPNQNQPGYNATIVLGQPDFFHTGCNRDSNWQNYPAPPSASASCLCGLIYYSQSPAEAGSAGNMAVDGAGNLYVPDYWNNRVLRYDWPISSGQSASTVWGQPNFTDYAPNNDGTNQTVIPTNSNLNFHSPGNELNIFVAGVGVDFWGNLWVVDEGNNRVLRFPNPNAPNPGVPSQTADVVLGQGAFNTADDTNLYQPSAVRVDKAGNVYVSGWTTLRYSGGVGALMIYSPTSYSGGVPVYGSNMVSVPNRVVTQTMVNPNGLEWDAPTPGGGGQGIGGPPSQGGTGGLWVTDNYDTITLFQITLASTSPATVLSLIPKKVLLSDGFDRASGGTTGDNLASPDFIDATARAYPSWGSPGMAGNGIFGSVGVDAQGNVFVANKEWQDVWRFPAPIPTPQPQVAHSADVDVFKPYHYGGVNGPGTHGMYYSLGIAVGYSLGVTQIIQSSDLIRFWNMPPSGPQGLQNGQTVDGLVGAPDSVNYPLSGPPSYFDRIKTDRAGHLWALSGGPRISVFNLPLVNAEAVLKTLQPPLPDLEGTMVNWSRVDGLAVDPNANFLWISDPPNSRVMRIRNPMTNNPVIDIILGQPNALSGVLNYPSGTPTQQNLHQPGAVELDHQGDLFVSDHSLEVSGDGRLLRYDAATVTNVSNTATLFLVPASAVYGAGGLTNFSSPGCVNPLPDSGVCAPWGVSFNPDDSLMVVGQDGQATNNFFSLVIANPLVSDNPITHLSDFDSQSYSSTFDDAGNLYVANHNRSRVLIYLQPLSSPSPTPTPSLTSTWTPTPYPTGTFTASFTPSATPTASPTLTITSTMTPTPTRTPSFTPTFSPTATITFTSTQTFTPTITPTPIPVTFVCQPYPNPATGNNVFCCFTLSQPAPVNWAVFTTAFRKIYGKKVSESSGGTFVWDLRDQWGTPAANGLYYLRVDIGGSIPVTKILKIIVEH